MQAIVLREEGYVTYPAGILSCIEEEVRSLNWHISNLECGCCDARNPFPDCGELVLSGGEFFDLIRANPEIQFIWGLFSGFPRGFDLEELKSRAVVDIRSELPYLDNGPCHVEAGAVLEIVAFDSSETHVLADNGEIIEKLRRRFPKAENLC